jgi:8-oxo-dGTP diphosphatase
MKKYVLGFIFSENLDKVVLIKKNRPETHCGLLNGIGGLVESFDKNVMAAMNRECYEETGVDIEEWLYFKSFGEEDIEEPYKVYCYTSTYKDMSKFYTKTDEEVAIYKLSDLDYEKCMSTVKDLIVKALEQHYYKEIK